MMEREGGIEPRPLTRQRIAPHLDPVTEQLCPERQVYETFSYAPEMGEIVRVKAVCPRCWWTSLRIVPEQDEECVDSSASLRVTFTA